jgi:hypothetical protein
MAAGYTSWTVTPHGALEKRNENLWRVQAPMPGQPDQMRGMSLARLSDGRIVMHNAIALDDSEMAELDAWGEVAAILVPNGFHRQDAWIMKERYPKAKVYAPTNAVKRVKAALPVDGTFSDAPGDASVTVRHVAGTREREGVMTVRSADGTHTAVFCDLLLNVPLRTGWKGALLHPSGTLSVPRFAAWMLINDKQLVRADLEGLAGAEGVTTVIPGHGDTIATDTRERLREAAARLG